MPNRLSYILRHVRAIQYKPEVEGMLFRPKTIYQQHETSLHREKRLFC
jgi:hypothetical protein